MFAVQLPRQPSQHISLDRHFKTYNITKYRTTYNTTYKSGAKLSLSTVYRLRLDRINKRVLFL